ncbi:unnamed protein product [Psylliodes chrysocephalus]|uniref:Uncharacterized protein n=1 Tax=Psylliodes chrysocephalus TaxID=3402493 RepID=A0A9P0CFC5_9CUCU|nr:unnamed protein product [Psylliodes chrysocephala]
MAEQKRCQTTGEPPIDGRGRHTNRPHKMSEQTCELLLQGRKAHYSLKNSNRVYLPEDMNQKAKITELDRKIAAEKSDDKKVKLDKEGRKLETEKILHLKRVDRFYELKRREKTEATPNITSAGVYFRRQLFYIFNVHILSTGASVMYTYDQTVAKKGSDDVALMLYHFFNTYLDPAVKKLYIFADSYGDKTKTTQYPVSPLMRGYSFMEPDKNMGLIPKSAKAETPDGWREVIEAARTKPYPFVVVSCEQVMFKGWGNFCPPSCTRKSSRSSRTQPALS